MIERRTRRRCSASLRLEPSKLIGPTTFSDSGKPKFGLVVTGKSTSTVAPAGMSSSLAAADPRTSAGDSSAWSERLVTVPLIRPSDSRSAASTMGPVALPSARTVRSEPNPTSRSRTRDGVPSSTSRPAPVPPPNTSPFIGVASRESPSTRSWNVARVGLKMPRYVWAVAWSVPGAPRTIATWWTITSEPRSSAPIPNAPIVNTPIRTGTVIHAHSRRSSRLRMR